MRGNRVTAYTEYANCGIVVNFLDLRMCGNRHPPNSVWGESNFLNNIEKISERPCILSAFARNIKP